MLADISIFNALCQTTKITNGWQNTRDRRASYVGMARGGILHALQILSGSTIGYTPKEVTQFIQGILTEFYQKNPNGHIHKQEAPNVQRTGLIRREGQTEFAPSRDGASATPEELMKACVTKLGNVQSMLQGGLTSKKDALNAQQMMNHTIDYMEQLSEYNKKTPIQGFRNWYLSVHQQFQSLRPKFEQQAKSIMR